MKRKLSALLLAALVTACGGGGEDSTVAAPPEAAIPTTPSQASEAAPSPVAPQVQLAADAPNNNLDLLSSGTYATNSASIKCGYQMPSKLLTGLVTSVHDGDTIKIGDTNIRLDSIDAPELAQTYGVQSKENLAALVNGKTVYVYYAKLDKYGRTVGSVFTSDCIYVNLQQVKTGSAWHYKQYQCEQPASLRSDFSAAQAAAEAADQGLWAFVATPPWVYRNGIDPAAPTCSSDSPTWLAAVSSVIPAVIPPSSSTGSGSSTYTPVTGCKTVWVNSYTRKDGTRVKGHYRTTCY